MADWYVRPSGGSYGDEDGTSYDNAWDGFSNISWAGMSSGDALYVCGTHRETLQPTADGITIRLDLATDLGYIYGSTQDDGTGWTGPDGNGEYTKDVSVTARGVFKDGVVVTEGTIASLGANEWDNSGTTLYLGFDPSGTTLEILNREAIAMPVSGSTSSDLTFELGDGGIYYSANEALAWVNDVQASLNGGDLIVRGGTFTGGEVQAIHSGSGGTGQSTYDSITIENVTITGQGGEGIYLRHDDGTAHDATKFCIVRGCDIGGGSFGWDGNNTAYQGDGIDSASDYFTLLVERNHIHDLHRGMVISNAYATIQDNLLVDCENANASAGEEAAAIRLDPDDSSGHVYCYRNDITQSSRDDGIMVRGGATANTPLTIVGNKVDLTGNTTHACAHQPSTNNDGAKWYQNTFNAGEYGFRVQGEAFSSLSTGAAWKNNIVYNNDFVVHITTATTTDLDAAYNCMYDSGAEANPYSVGGTGYASVSALETAKSNFANNLESDPKLKDAANGDLRLDGDSPCIAAGTRWWSGETPRGEDGLRFYDPPSMGAYEYREDSGGASVAGVYPVRVLEAGVDEAKVRSA